MNAPPRVITHFLQYDQTTARNVLEDMLAWTREWEEGQGSDKTPLPVHHIRILAQDCLDLLRSMDTALYCLREEIGMTTTDKNPLLKETV